MTVTRWGALLLILLPRACAAVDVVGYLADFSSVVEVRDRPLPNTDKPHDLQLGDTVVTKAAPDRRGTARVFLADRETITLAGNSELYIGGGTDTPEGMRSTTVRLNSGRIRIYAREGSDCRIETPAGSVTCLHTDFVVAFDRATEEMNVLVIDGNVDVSGVGAASGSAVTVHPYQVLRVSVGQRPGAPTVASEAVRGQFTQGLELIGDGVSERMAYGDELAKGTRVLVVDRPANRRPSPWGDDHRQEQPGKIADPLFGVPGNLQVNF